MTLSCQNNIDFANLPGKPVCRVEDCGGNATTISGPVMVPALKSASTDAANAWMSAVRTSLLGRQLPDKLRSLRDAIEERVPVGRGLHGVPMWSSAREVIRTEVTDLLSRFSDLTPAVKRLLWRSEAQLGTLGGGNHFIEICLDTEDRVWIMLARPAPRRSGPLRRRVEGWRTCSLALNRS